MHNNITIIFRHKIRWQDKNGYEFSSCFIILCLIYIYNIHRYIYITDNICRVYYWLLICIYLIFCWIYIYIYIHTHTHVCVCNYGKYLTVKKWYLLNTQHYKVCIKGKCSNPWKGVRHSLTLWRSSYRKGCLHVTLEYGWPTNHIYILTRQFSFQSMAIDFLLEINQWVDLYWNQVTETGRN